MREFLSNKFVSGPLIAICLNAAFCEPARSCTPSTHTKEILYKNSQIIMLATQEITTFLREDNIWIGEITLRKQKILKTDLQYKIPDTIRISFAATFDDEGCGQFWPGLDSQIYFLSVVNSQFQIDGTLNR